LIDGDRAELRDPQQAVYLLPGDRAPEAHVFDRVLDRLDVVAAKLTAHMQLPLDWQERVKSVIKERALTNRDRHVIYEQVGEDLDFTAGYIVASAFLAIWAQQYPEEVEALLAQFEDVAPMKPHEQSGT
jgi:hypothetical protein